MLNSSWSPSSLVVAAATEPQLHTQGPQEQSGIASVTKRERRTNRKRKRKKEREREKKKDGKRS